MEEQLKMLDAEETTPDSSLHKPESRREDKLPQDVSLVSPEEINLSLGPNLDTPRPTHLSTARSTASGSENIEQPSELKEDSVGAELIEACRRGDSDAIRKLMMDGADINVELNGETPFRAACAATNQLSAIQQVLVWGASCDEDITQRYSGSLARVDRFDDNISDETGEELIGRWRVDFVEKAWEEGDYDLVEYFFKGQMLQCWHWKGERPFFMLFCYLLWSKETNDLGDLKDRLIWNGIQNALLCGGYKTLNEHLHGLVTAQVHHLMTPMVTYNQNKTHVFAMLRRVAQDSALSHRLLLGLVFLWVYLRRTAKKHNSVRQEMNNASATVEGMIREVLNCDSVDQEENLHRLLLDEVHFESCQSCLVGNVESYLLDELSSLKSYQLHTLAFSDSNVLGICRKYEIKSVFATTAVSTMLDRLFKGRQCPTRYFRAAPHQCLDVEYTGVTFPFHARYCPRNMFLLGGASKLLQLTFLFVVSVQVYGEHELVCAPIWCGGPHSRYEVVLLVLMCSGILYEFGQIQERGIKDYGLDLWNSLDICVHLLLLLWAILLPLPSYFQFCRIALAVASIPLSISLLQYIVDVQELGIFVIMFFAMLKDLAKFIFIYFVFLIGFGMALYSIFHGADGFTTKGGALLTLFDATLGNYDFTEFGVHPDLSGVGVAILILFVTLNAILLLNMLIATMSNTHATIAETALEEWSFTKANILKEHMLIRERSTLCMLPPPLNIVTTLLSPFQYYYRNFATRPLSPCGSVADILLQMIYFGFVRPLFSFVVLYWEPHVLILVPVIFVSVFIVDVVYYLPWAVYIIATNAVVLTQSALIDYGDDATRKGDYERYLKTLEQTNGSEDDENNPTSQGTQGDGSNATSKVDNANSANAASMRIQCLFTEDDLIRVFRDVLSHDHNSVLVDRCEKNINEFVRVQINELVEKCEKSENAVREFVGTEMDGMSDKLDLQQVQLKQMLSEQQEQLNRQGQMLNQQREQFGQILALLQQLQHEGRSNA